MRAGVVVVVGSVHVQQQPPGRIESRQLIGTDFTHVKTLERVGDTQQPGLDACLQVRREAPLPRCAERVVAAGIARHGHVGGRAGGGQVREESRVEKRHVAGHHHNLFRWRFNQGRIKSSERPRPVNAIPDHRHARVAISSLVVGDDQDVRSEPADGRELAIENGAISNRQRALVDAAEPPRPAAGENSRGEDAPFYIRKLLRT